VEYRIKVIANAKKEGVTLLRDGRLSVSVDALRKEGRANERACALIAGYLHVPVAQVTLIKGHTQSTKVVRVRIS
jgi:uncharacterized protein YggU (UPF0235/DUF167 family)